MKYTDWVDPQNNYPHYAEGYQYDKFMAEGYKECQTKNMPIPQELVDWWYEKYIEFGGSQRIRNEYNLHETMYPSDWNSRARWPNKEVSSEKTIRTRDIEVEVTYSPTSGDAPTVVIRRKPVRELLPGQSHHISVQVISKN